MPEQLNSRCQELVTSLLMYFEQERDNNGPLLPLTAVREISSQEICQVYIERIKNVNPILNAVIQDRFEEAIKEARLVDSYLEITSLTTEELEKFKPLLGVPITIKESCSVKGMSLSSGLRARLDYKAENDGEAVARIKSSGAIILLVSATPQHSLSWETYSFINGATSNPYDTTCTAGGSSGGEGALLGAGASLIGIGSDIAGSIRLPAMFNGIFGHKPTPRTVSIKGHYPLAQDEQIFEYLVIGPLVRYATDLKLLMRVMCGDKISTELRLNEPVDLEKLNVYFMEDFGFHPTLARVTKDIKVAVNKSARHLKETCGAVLQDYKFEDFNQALEICGSALFSVRNKPSIIRWENTNPFKEILKILSEKSDLTLNALHFKLLETIFLYLVSDLTNENKKLKAKVMEKLGANGILLFPVFNEPAFKHHQIFLKNGFGYLIIPNALGLPSTSVPCGFDKNGMPTGIQVIAAPYQDRLCIAVAEELERYFGGWIPPPEQKRLNKI